MQEHPVWENFKNKKGRKEKRKRRNFYFLRCIGGIDRKLNKIVVIPFIEVYRWSFRRLWINHVFNVWRGIGGILEGCG